MQLKLPVTVATIGAFAAYKLVFARAADQGGVVAPNPGFPAIPALPDDEPMVSLSARVSGAGPASPSAAASPEAPGGAASFAAASCSGLSSAGSSSQESCSSIE